MTRAGHALLCGLAALLLGCAGNPGAPGVASPPGPDTSEPFPIDRGDDGFHTPGTYKGLWLRLADNGAPALAAVDGIIGLVCVGMSNAFQECGAFVDHVRGAWSGEVNVQVRVANCAVGGHAIERWNDAGFDDTLWDACIRRRLPQAGIRSDQVRVLYHKAANQFTTGPNNSSLPAYPAAGSDYERFLANLATFAQRVPEKFPAVQAVYTSSRSYGGYAPHPGRGEPLSHEEGHALNTWLRSNRHVSGVWYGWGPYIWAPDCGTGVHNGAGLCYVREDYVADGVHPSTSGQLKIARALHDRLREHAWYRR
jgi:lysophospholipase L1-like esterase